MAPKRRSRRGQLGQVAGHQVLDRADPAFGDGDPDQADTTGLATEKELAVESCEKPWKYASETTLSPLTARNAVVPVDRRNASRSRSPPRHPGAPARSPPPTAARPRRPRARRGPDAEIPSRLGRHRAWRQHLTARPGAVLVGRGLPEHVRHLQGRAATRPGRPGPTAVRGPAGGRPAPVDPAAEGGGGCAGLPAPR